jgi:hypothetical protein
MFLDDHCLKADLSVKVLEKSLGPPLSLKYQPQCDNIVICTPIARQRVGKDIPAETNAPNNKTSIARQRGCKQASLTIEDGVFLEVHAEGLS